MKAYLAHIRATMKLTMRDRTVLFFNYLLPLLFFVVFAQSFGADKGGAISQVITMVLIMGTLGSGFFGAGLRAVQERELNILRRYKVAPITPMPILVSSLVTGVIAYLPSLAMILAVSHFLYGMPWPERWISLTLLLTLGLVSFRSIGLTIAAVTNSMQESQIIIQLMYLPMLFLSGATFPVSMLPNWLQVAAQFMPATYLYTGMNGILVRKESLGENWLPVAGMLVTTVMAILLAVKLFRWEKDEKFPTKAKAWIAAVMLPFLLIGGWQMYRQDNIVKARTLFRDMKRNRALLLRGPAVFTGERVIPSGGVLIQDGKIVEIYEHVPAEDAARAEVLEAAGKTLLPGLVDASVRLSEAGGTLPPERRYDPQALMERELAAYLYSGVTAVRDDEASPLVIAAASKVASGERLGAELIRMDPADTVRTEDAAAVAEALRKGARVITNGSARDLIPETTFAEMAKQGVVYVPALAAVEARIAAGQGKPDLLMRTLVQQVAPEGLIGATRAMLSEQPKAEPQERLETASTNVLRAWKAGVRLVTGTGSGTLLLVHGPAIHRELRLWAAAGVAPEFALQAATRNAARHLGIGDRVGRIDRGMDASFLVVDGDPLEEISATERISSVFFRGERVERGGLLDQK